MCVTQKSRRKGRIISNSTLTNERVVGKINDDEITRIKFKIY